MRLGLQRSGVRETPLSIRDSRVRVVFLGHVETQRRLFDAPELRHLGDDLFRDIVRPSLGEVGRHFERIAIDFVNGVVVIRADDVVGQCSFVAEPPSSRSLSSAPSAFDADANFASSFGLMGLSLANTSASKRPRKCLR